MSQQQSRHEPVMMLPAKGSQQKVMVFGSTLQASVEERVRPVPAAGRRGHVRIQVQAVGLNPVDAKKVIGDKLPDSWKTLHQMAHRLLVQETVVGFDFAGMVAEPVATGGFEPGCKVYGCAPPLVGSCAEYISVPLHQVARMPASMTFLQAAALPLVGLTALQCLEPLQDHIRNRSVLIVGASGGTGHVALQVAKHGLAAAHVTAVCSTASFDDCRANGATHCIDYRQDSSQLTQALQQAPGCPYDVVLDCVTSADPRDSAVLHYPTLLQQEAATGNLLLLSNDYQYRRLGGPSPDWMRASLARTVGWQCWRNPRERLFWIQFPHCQAGLKQLQAWVDERHLHASIERVYDFDAASVQQAFDDLLSRRVKGKVVVRVAADSQEKDQE